MASAQLSPETCRRACGSPCDGSSAASVVLVRVRYSPAAAFFDCSLRRTQVTGPISKKGTPAVGKIRPSTQSAQWRRENLSEGYFRLKNRWRGTDLHIERGKVEVSKIETTWYSAMWKIEPYRKNRDYFCLKNLLKGMYLTNAGGKLNVVKGKCN